MARKRHIAVDTDGRLLMINLTPADISDSAGAQMILDGVRKRWPWLKHLFADGAYDRTQLMDKAAFRDFTIQIVKRSDTAKGFEIVPRRWVVERTFGWMTRWRRLVRDNEMTVLLVDLVTRRHQIVEMMAAEGQRERRAPKRLQKSIARLRKALEKEPADSTPSSTTMCAGLRCGSRRKTCSPSFRASGRSSPAP